MPKAFVKPSRIAQWGNSAAVRLSASMLERANLHRDDAIDIIARDDEIIIRRQVPHLSLDDLLARFDPKKHRHDLMLDAPPVGRETI